jgi:hypothetical protein
VTKRTLCGEQYGVLGKIRVWNNYHKKHPDTGKTALSYYIAGKLDLKDLRFVTPREDKLTAKVNVGEFPLK